MKKSIVFVIFLMLLIPNKCEAKEIIYDQYKTDLGFTINSYSENWTGNKLIEVYEEFKKNTYGKEIKYLKEINLYSGNPKGGKEEGVYNASYKQLEILGKVKILFSKNNSIDLYNLKDKDTVDDIAKTLSHEYGHHFTLYYLIQHEDKTFEQWKDTQMYQKRKLSPYEDVTNSYKNGHEWSVIEICAEDYVQLYGSPTAKKVFYFNDIEGRYGANTINNSTSYSYSIFNLNPQENNHVPLALETLEIKQYWEEASGIPSKVKGTGKPALALVRVTNLGYDKMQYKFQWSKSINQEKQEALSYTLVATDLEGNEIIPIKTVKRGEKLEAVVGSIRVTEKDNILFYTDSFIDSEKIFKVYAISTSGGIVSSESLKINFDNPKATTLKSQVGSMSDEQATKDEESEQVTLNAQVNNYIDKVLNMILLFFYKITNE